MLKAFYSGLPVVTEQGHMTNHQALQPSQPKQSIGWLIRIDNFVVYVTNYNNL